MPDAWQQVELAKVCSLPERQVRPQEFQKYEYYVGLEDIESDTGRIIEYKKVRNAELRSSKFSFDSTCILYGKLRPYLNKVVIPNVSGICSTDILPLRPNTNAISRDFLFYFLRSPDFVKTATERSTGANLPRISPDSLLSILIPLPPIETQRKLAQILLKSDELLRKRAAVNGLTNRIVQSTFLKMFGDPSTNQFGWLTRPLSSILAAPLAHGLSLSREKVRERNVGIPVLRLGALAEDGFDSVQIKNYDEGLERVRDWLLEPNDILISRSNTIELVGRVGRYSGDPPVCIYPDLMIRVRARPDETYPEYLEHYLRSAFVRKFFRRRARGTSGSMPKISNTDVSQVPVHLPPLERQEQFSLFVRETEGLQRKQIQSSREIKELFHSLMQRAFRGELQPRADARGLPRRTSE